MIWWNKSLMKTEKMWKELSKDTRYLLLGLSDKQIEEIHAKRAKKKKNFEATKGGEE
jgi:phage-related minor tail protein